MDELEKAEEGAKKRAQTDNRLLYALIAFMKKTKHNLCGDIHDLLVEVDKLPGLECDPITLDYREYAKRTTDLVARLRDLLSKTAGNRPITKFCFCGSSSRVPAVLRMYKEFAQNRGRFSEVVQADETVARGLCYWGFLRTTENPGVKAIPVMRNRWVEVDGVEMAAWDTFDMSGEAEKLRKEGDKEWVEVNEETEKRKGLTSSYQESVKQCKEWLEE